MTALLERDMMRHDVAEASPRFAIMPQTHSAEFSDPCADDRWDRALAAHGDATIFHSSAWAKVLRDAYGHERLYLSHDGALLPLMEVASPLTGKRGVSLPFSDVCEPLDLTESLREHACAIARERGWKYLELRGPDPADGPATFYVHALDLIAEAHDLFARCASAFQRGVRKAERSAVTVAIRNDADALRDFYRLHAQTRRRHGVPPQPFSFFENIQKHILAAGLGFIVFASRGARPVAAAVFLHFNQHGIFKFGASDASQQEHRPSNLVMWEGIKECARRGLTTLHLGRTDPHQEGLRRFKLSLGTTEKELRYTRFYPAQNRWSTVSPRKPGALSAAVFRRLPLTANRVAGTMIYPHLH